MLFYNVDWVILWWFFLPADQGKGQEARLVQNPLVFVEFLQARIISKLE
jgi:hypothetical protein